EHLIGFGVVDEVAQPAPGTLHLLKTLVVQDEIDLLRELLVDLGDDRLDGADHIVGYDCGVAQRLLCKGAYGGFNFGPRAIGLGFELLLQERSQLVGLECRGASPTYSLCFSHLRSPPASPSKPSLLRFR